ncbi:MAG: HEAT repeat domain-containing protein [Candidatus Binataceae bacterium]
MKPNADADSLIAALSPDTPARCINALVRVIENPPDAISANETEAITRCLCAESKTIRRRAADALAAIARRDSRILTTLRATLNHTDRQTRFGAAYALGASGEGALTIDTAPALFDALGDQDGDVRWAAAELIVRLGQAYPVEILAGLLALVREGNPAARKMALYCIRDLGPRDGEVLDAAATASHDVDIHVRLSALALLAASFSTSDAAAALALERLESDRDDGVRRAAAVALGNMQNVSARIRDSLERAAANASDNSLARAARAALDRIARNQ